MNLSDQLNLSDQKNIFDQIHLLTKWIYPNNRTHLTNDYMWPHEFQVISDLPATTYPSLPLVRSNGKLCSAGLVTNHYPLFPEHWTWSDALRCICAKSNDLPNTYLFLAKGNKAGTIKYCHTEIGIVQKLTINPFIPGAIMILE